MTVCWLDGVIVPSDQARVSVFDHGVLYGDGVFEGIRFYQRQAFRLDAHLRRLQDSARAIKLNLPYSVAELETAIYAVIQAFDQADGYIRLVITRGRGSLGINPTSCARGTAFIIADKLSVIDPRVKNHGAKLMIAATRRLAPDGLDPRIKSLNYLNHVMARIEANEAGADEALLLNAQGHVTEGSADNIFIVRDNALLTPQVSDGALAGITRGVIMALADGLGLPCKECSLSAYDLYTADECLLTGTAMELMPVREIDGRKLSACPGPVFEQLSQAFVETIRDEVKQAQLRQVSA